MIGNRIRDLRLQHHLSQTALSKSINVSQQTITKWETGKAEPSSSALNSLANFFNVSTDYLVGRTDVKNPGSRDLDEAIDGAMSFDGQPVTEHDRKVMKSLWKAYLASKD